MPGPAEWIMSTWSQAMRDQQARDLNNLRRRGLDRQAAQLEAARQEEYHQGQAVGGRDLIFGTGQAATSLIIDEASHFELTQEQRNFIETWTSELGDEGPQIMVNQNPEITESSPSIAKRLLGKEIDE